MATRSQIESALIAADKAGNVEDARALADALKNMPVEKAQPPTTKSIMFDAIDANLRAQGLPSRGMAAGVARYGAAIPGSAGGPLGAAFNAGGEAVAQVIESGGIENPGAVTGAGITGSVPFAAAGSKLRTLQNIGRTVGGVIAGEEARSLIDDGQLSDPTQPAVIAGGLATVAPVAGRLAGKIMGKTDAADAAAKAIEQSRNQTRDASLKAGQEIGMVVPPTAVNDTWINRRLEGLAGGPRVGREATVINNVKGGEALRADAGLGPGAALNDDTFAALKHTAAEPYRRIAAMSENGGFTMYHDGAQAGGFLTTDAAAVKAGSAQSAKINPKNPLIIDGEKIKTLEDRAILMPDWKEQAFAKGHDAIIIDNGSGRIDAFIPENFDKKAVIFKGTPIETAATDLEAMKQARNDANGFFRRNATNYDPENITKANDALEKARHLEDRIRNAALQSGDKKLMADFMAARTQYAKLDDMQRALNPDSGEINLNKIGKLSQKGEPLTGKLKTVADFSNAFEGRFTKPTASIPNPGSSALEGPSVLFGGVLGGLKGATVAASNVFLRDPIRNAILSKPGQRLLATPNYVTRTVADQQVTNMAQRIAAIMALQMGSQVNPEKNPFMPQPVGQP